MIRRPCLLALAAVLSSGCVDRSTTGPLSTSESVVRSSGRAFSAVEATADANTVLLDHFNGSILGTSHGITFEASLPGFDRAARLGPGIFAIYSFPGWHPWCCGGTPGVEGTVEAWLRPDSRGSFINFNWNGPYMSWPPAGHVLYAVGPNEGWTTPGAAFYQTWNWERGRLQDHLGGVNPYPLGEWTHFAISWGPGGSKIYFNGVVEGSSPDNVYPALGSTVWITLNDWGGGRVGMFSGLVDELHISRVQRTDAEIALHAQKPRTNQAPAADAGGPYSVTEGSAIALSGATASDPDAGDVLSYSWSVNTTGIDAGGSCSFSPANTVLNPSITCTDDSQGAAGGKFVLTLAVDDGNGHVVTDNTDLTVGNVAPHITTIVSPLAPLAVGPGNVTVSWDFTDSGADTWTCEIEWDTSLGFVAASYAPSKKCAASNSLPSGVYTVTIKGTDDDGASDSHRLTTNVVVFDPDGGFVTGGGWILSARNAYAADPTITGKATFGFVSKYEKGKTLPEGNLEFHIQAANLSFRSTSHQWLVVSGPLAQYKGAGTINGAGNYGFLLTAIDGQASGGGIDRFRIKIWEIGGTVVYDSGMGAAEDSDAATSLGGGSIVIHTRK